MSDLPPSLMDHIQEQLDPVHAAKLKALDLFCEIRGKLGDARARRIFAIWGTPPSASKMAKLKNYGLLDRLDMMKPKPVVLKLAKQLAKENLLLPRGEQRGAGSTDAHALEKHIRTLVKKRESGLKAKTWHGPITPEQAVRHFGAKKVETSSKKR
jgi:hypothetical protein